jgi:hypothetical protein
MDAVNSTEKLEKLKGEVKGADSNE